MIVHLNDQTYEFASGKDVHAKLFGGRLFSFDTLYDSLELI